MDTQTLVKVTALSSIRHGADGGEVQELNAGDSFELTAHEAAPLIALGVVIASDEVKQQVAQVEAKSAEIAAEQEPEAVTLSSNTAATTNEGVTQVVTTQPSPADISETLTAVETTPLQ